MNPRIKELLEQIRARHPGDSAADGGRFEQRQLPAFSELLVFVAEQQEQSAAKTERQTRHLIWLTWALVVLTVALLFYTVMLYQDAREQKQRAHLTYHHADQ